MGTREYVGLALVTAIFSFALSVFMAGGGLFLTGRVDWVGLIASFPLAMAIMTLTYIPHVYAHIATAKDLGYDVGYRVVASKAVVAMIFSVLMAFPLVAPRRIVVYERESEPYYYYDQIRRKTVERNIFFIAYVGPLVNIINSSIGLAIFFIAKIELIWLFSFVNAGFAMWSLLPFMDMDGERMMSNKPKWAGMMALAVLLLILSIKVAIDVGTGATSA